MTDYTDLIAFLNARLDEDEAIAREATRTWDLTESGFEWHELHRETYVHARRHDPARTLREVKAKRAIIERYEFLGGHGPARDNERAMDMTTGAWAALRDVLKVLAGAYADHPEYREEWRPE